MNNLRLERVTISGVDGPDSNILELRYIQEEFPFVEWGVLFSAKNQGLYARYPRLDWISKLVENVGSRCSAHLCGQQARDVFEGNFSWFKEWGRSFARVQLNGFSVSSVTTDHRLVTLARDWPRIEFIMQAQTHDALERAWALTRVVPNISALYDPSGGRGMAVKEWPFPPPGLKMGYAGGIGPKNVVDVLTALSLVDRGWTWVDMESKVRMDADDDSASEALDLDRVRAVLKSCVSFRG